MCHYIFTRLYFQNYVESFIISPEVAPRQKSGDGREQINLKLYN